MNDQFPPSTANVEELRQRFAHLTRLLYDTDAPMAVVRRDVFPYLSRDIVFLDPLVHIRGSRLFQRGRQGFHCTFKFDFDITQIGVQLNDRKDGGRVMVDGVMNLRSLIVYTYPLRTMLVYEFALTNDKLGITITRLEELWSTGDLFANLPILGGVYDVARLIFGRCILGLFALSCAITKNARPSFYR